MSTAAVISQQSNCKRSASFGDRMKKLLRASSQKNKNDLPYQPKHLDLQKHIRVQSDPQLVHVSDKPITSNAVVETPSKAPKEEETMYDPSLCPTDDSRDPATAVGVLDVSYASSATSLDRPLRPVAVVPVSQTAEKERPSRAQEDAGSTGTNSTASTSEPAEVESPTIDSSAYYSHHHCVPRRNGDDSHADDESVSLLTFDYTLRSTAQTITQANELTYDTVMGAIGNMVDQQWRAFERTISCDQAEPHLEHIDEEDEVIFTRDSIDYVPSDQEHSQTGGPRMDNKVLSGITTPSTGTRLISNAPKDKKLALHDSEHMNDLLSSGSEDEDDDEEDELIQVPQVDMRRAASEAAERTTHGSKPMRSRSSGDVDSGASAIDILKDLSRNDDEFTYLRSIASSSAKENTSASGGHTSQEIPGWAMFHCGVCEPDKLFACEGETHPTEVDGILSNESTFEDEEDDILQSRTATVEAAVVAPEGKHNSIPASLPGKPTTPEPTEEASLEQTVESYQQLIDALKKYKTNPTLAENSQEKNRLLKKFRTEFPDIYTGLMTDLGTKSEIESAVNKTRAKEGEKSTGTSARKLSSFSLRGNKTPKSTSAKETKKSRVGLLGFISSSAKMRGDKKQLKPKQDIKQKKNLDASTPVRNDSQPMTEPPESKNTRDDVSPPLAAPKKAREPFQLMKKVRSATSMRSITASVASSQRGSSTQTTKKQPPSPMAKKSTSSTATKKNQDASTNKKSKTDIPKKEEAEVPKKGDEIPLGNFTRSSSSTSKKSSVQSQRKVAFSRTPLIMQRFQMSRTSSGRKHQEPLEEGVSFLLENEKGVSLKTSSWYDDDNVFTGYTAPFSGGPLMTSHEIPHQPTAPSPVQQLYASGNREFEEFS